MELSFEKWKERLLDLGKRNRLINFKHAKFSTLEGYVADFDATFNTLADDGSPIKVVEEEKKSNQIRFYKQELPYEKILKKLQKKAKDTLEEKGINVLFLTFGYLNYVEDGEKFSAPIFLVPVKITRETAISPYYIELYEDETVVNPTLCYKLNVDYNISLPPFSMGETLPSDYLNELSRLFDPLNWWVSKSIRLGLFSYLKLNMYLDLKNNEDLILSNSNIMRLLGIMRQEEESPALSPNAVEDFHNVVDADSSQLEAIRLSKRGESFVLQGPPGTGKSQTITNMIAEFLADKKKVLFVSEKPAALNIVYNNLKKAGLSDFCLELHSHKISKKVVIDELNRVLTAEKKTLSSSVSLEWDNLNVNKEKLDEYASALHRTNPSLGLSPYELFEELSKCFSYPETSFVLKEAEKKGRSFLSEAERLLEDYASYTSTIGYDYRLNEWFGYDKPNASMENKELLKKALENLKSGIGEIIKIKNRLNDKYFLQIKCLSELPTYVKLLTFISKLRYYAPRFFKAETLAIVINRMTEMSVLATQIKEMAKELENEFAPSFFETDGKILLSTFKNDYSSAFKRLSGAYRKTKGALLKYGKGKLSLSYKEICERLEKLTIYQELQASFAENEEYAIELFDKAYDGINTDFKEILANLNQINSFLSAGVDLMPLSLTNKGEFVKWQSDFEQLTRALKQEIKGIAGSLSVFTSFFSVHEYNVEADAPESLYNKVALCYEGFGNLENYCRFYRLLTKLDGLGIKGFLSCVLDEKLAADDFAMTFRKVYYKSLVEYILDEDDVLREFNRASQDNAVRNFSEKDKLQFEISKARIIAALSADRPNVDMIAAGSQVSILLREGGKKRRQMPVRKILGDLSELVQLLKPCFLMSPLSVATFLDGKDIRFDAVIFDEASQIFPEDAVGAIYRAKKIIVVGDTQQMPPSNFFTASVSEEGDGEDDYSLDCFESILDMASSCFRQNRLMWHYRSRIEDLIAFSNQNFYDNRLQTFPSAKRKEENFGIDFCQVNGTYNRQSGTNLTEARKVAELVFEHFKTFPERSLGVVAFSISQQGLIEDEIYALREKTPGAEAFFNETKKEPFFVKNLETVQGDERDTIIFSIAYAPDEEGKFLHNFGPLNKNGGERRLNVAITRAKRNIKVVSSIEAKDIDLSKSTATGTRLLKEYLDYAARGAAALRPSLPNSESVKPHSEIIASIDTFLTGKGFICEQSVGFSSYKIDLAVKDLQKNEYVLAIEGDGEGYAKCSSTRDRDRLRREVLRGLGWNHYRMWSTDWIKNQSAEKELLYKTVAAAVSPKEEKPQNYETAAGQSFLDTISGINAPMFKYYRFAEVKLLVIMYKRKNDLTGLVREIAKIEAPISEEWLLKRIVSFFDREKVTEAVRKEFDRRLNPIRELQRSNGFIYNTGEGVELRVPQKGAAPRELKYICNEELCYGIIEIVKQNVAIKRDSLYRAFLGYLGIGHISEPIKDRFDGLVNEMLEQRIFNESDGGLQLAITLL